MLVVITPPGRLSLSVNILSIDSDFSSNQTKLCHHVSCLSPPLSTDMSGPDAHNESVNPAELTEAEQLLWKAFPRGAWVDLGRSPAGKPAVIRAEVMSALLLGAVPAEPGSAAGMRLRGATVVGRLDLTGGTAEQPLVCESCKFDTELSFVDGSVRTVRILDSELPGLDATRLRLDGILDLTGSSIAGCVRLEHAKVSGQLRMRSSRVGAGSEAVAATGLSVDGDVDCSRMEARGGLTFPSANVVGTVDLTGTRITSPGGRGLVLSHATIGGKLECPNLAVTGETRANNCRVGAQVSMNAARLHNPGKVAFFAGGLTVVGGAFFRGVSATGEFRLIGAHLAANLTLSGGTFDNPGGVAVNLEGAVVASVYGDGLTYQGLYPRLPAGQRLSWLARDPGGHQPQPYEQLAAHYTAIGQPAQARDVLYARERIQRRGKGPASRTWSLLQDITVGYGYRPRRALGWLALLLAAGSIVFSVAPPPVLASVSAPHFNGVVYTLDLMLPVVNLGQKYAFNPGGPEQWLSYFLIAAGWTLATTVAAGLARVLRRG